MNQMYYDEQGRGGMFNKIFGPGTPPHLGLAIAIIALLLVLFVLFRMDVFQKDRQVPDEVLKALTEGDANPREVPDEVIDALNTGSKKSKEVPEEVIQALQGN